MELHAHFVHAATHPRWPELVLAAEPDGDGDSVEIHGDDGSYTITVSSGMSIDGGIDGWMVEDGTLTLELEGAAGTTLGTGTPIVVEFDPAHEGNVAEVLEQLTGQAPAH